MFSDYEKHHLHDYVYKKGTLYTKQEVDNEIASLYTKQEVDNEIASLKSEITTLIQSSIQTALNKFKVELQKNHHKIQKRANSWTNRSEGSHNT